MNFNIRDMLVLMRISNLPTVWSNTFCGWTIGICFSQFGIRESSKLFEALFNFHLLFLLMGVSCIYTAGMVLNDLFDLEWDRMHRPQRPLVVKRLSVATARIGSAFLLITGAAFVVFGSVAQTHAYVGVFVLILVGLIFIYNRWHKGVAWAPYIMGLCRFMLPLIGFFASGATALVAPSIYMILFTHAASLWVLTVSIALLARHETSGNYISSDKDYFLFLVPVPLLLVLPWSALTLLSAFGYWVWLLLSNRLHPLPAGIIGRVEDRLAAFPFIDAMLVGLAWSILSPVGAVMLHAFIFSCFILILIGRRFVSTT